MGLVQREIVVIGPLARVAGFLDEVDGGEDQDQGGDDQPKDVVGGDAAGAMPFKIDEEPASEDGKNRPEFSQECFQSGLMNRKGRRSGKRNRDAPPGDPGGLVKLRTRRGGVIGELPGPEERGRCLPA